MPNISALRLSSGDYEREGRSCTRPAFAEKLRRGESTSCAVIRRSVSILAEARIYFVRRADRADRDHANRTGRKEKMDQPVAISSRAELLHAASRSGSATARDLHRLALAQNPRRHRGRRIFCPPVDLRSLGAELHLRGVW